MLIMYSTDNVKVWYSLKHPAKSFDFSVVTCSYKPPSGTRDLYSAMIVATVTTESGIREIHSKHDVRSRDSLREDTSKTRIEALETLLADLEWRMDLCMHQYDTKLKRAPRVSLSPLTSFSLLTLSCRQIVNRGSKCCIRRRF